MYGIRGVLVHLAYQTIPVLVLVVVLVLAVPVLDSAIGIQNRALLLIAAFITALVLGRHPRTKSGVQQVYDSLLKPLDAWLLPIVASASTSAVSWRQQQAIPSGGVLSEFCYLGLSWRARVGILYLSGRQLVHQSFPASVHALNMGEKAKRLAIPLTDITAISRRPLSWWERRLFVSPPVDHALNVVTRGQTYTLLLYDQAEMLSVERVLRNSAGDA